MYLTAFTVNAHAQDATAVVDVLLGKFRTAGNGWIEPLENAGERLFWLLALISLSWTFISLALKQSDLVEIIAELMRYIMYGGRDSNRGWRRRSGW